VSASAMRATAEARTNIALVKYWGKRDAALNLPAAGSLSMTLDGLVTQTTVEWDPRQQVDRLILDRVDAAEEARARVAAFLDLVRERTGSTARAVVTSTTNFPVASGLASSASGFAALALAATRSAGLELTAQDLSVLARRGSGSAARSIFGGFVEMLAGTREDGADAHAVQLVPESAWDVRMLVAVIGQGLPKSVSSRSGMGHTARTSPLFDGFIASVAADLAAARDAIARRDLEALGEVAERSALTMHASALAARPGLVYWRGASVEALHAIRELRREGSACWFTMDAGPHVKVLCTPDGSHARAKQVLEAIPGVSYTLTAKPGAGARVLP
jgi:diphosphomevalonate decarboxylase